MFQLYPDIFLLFVPDALFRHISTEYYSKAAAAVGLSRLAMCARGDSNPHVLRH